MSQPSTARIATIPAAGILAGRRILIVEDDTLLAMMLEDMVGMLDCTIAGVFNDVASASAWLSANPDEVDGALLDVNVAGKTSYDLAGEIVRCGGKVVFCTGYGDVPGGAQWQSAPQLTKPYSMDQLENTLKDMFAEQEYGAVAIAASLKT